MISEVEGWAELHWKCPRRNMTKKEEAMLKKIEKLNKEKQRIEEMCSYEKEYSQYDYICGIDEAGRGPLAGPVVVASVIMPKDSMIEGINDFIDNYRTNSIIRISVFVFGVVLELTFYSLIWNYLNKMLIKDKAILNIIPNEAISYSQKVKNALTNLNNFK